MENNKIFVFVAIALMSGLAGGYYYGNTTGYLVGYKTAQSEIRARLEANRLVESVPKEVKVISGTIKSIGADRFILESRLPFDPTLPEGEQSRLIEKTVIVTPQTEIGVRTVSINTEKPKAGQPAIPFIVKNIKTDFKSLQISESIIVEASENIAIKDAFEANVITKNGQ